MSLLFESIKIVDKKIINIFYHNGRVNKSRRDLLSLSDEINLERYIEIPPNIDNDVYKCRVLYDRKVNAVEFIKYEKKNINNLKVVSADDISYGYKYRDRKSIDILKENSKLLPEEDIIIIKNGLVTDTSFSNLVFYDDKNWVTPSHPLLAGTQRAKLLNEKKIIEKSIRIEDMKYFKKVKMINAMIDFDEAIEHDVGNFIVG